MSTCIDVMIDIETTGTNPSAAIAAIGAVAFDRSTRQLGATYYRQIDISTSVDTGGSIDADTFKWWMKQTKEAKQTFDGIAHIHEVLSEFGLWLERLQPTAGGEIRVWGNGADFDMVVLGQAYKNNHLPTPWKFWNVRCFRTLKAESPKIPMNRSGIHHNALDDAICQANHVLRIDAERNIPPTTALCQHRIVDARNPIITSGYVCVDCGLLLSAADHESKQRAVVQDDAESHPPIVKARDEELSELRNALQLRDNYMATARFVYSGCKKETECLDYLQALIDNPLPAELTTGETTK